MWILFYRLSVLSICVVAVLALCAEACSPGRDYIRETSFDLVDFSGAIVVAEAVEAIDAGGRAGAGVRFKSVETIKGTGPETIDVPYNYMNPEIRPSDPHEITEPHPQSLGGPCNRNYFSKNTEYILMLEQAEDGTWRRLGGPFTRNAEDYHGPESYWVRAIETYLEIQEQPDRMVQLDALYDLWKLNRDAAEGSFERALADDVNDHLWSLSWRKPTGYLVRMYEGLETALEGADPAPAPREPSILDALKGDAQRGLPPAPEENFHWARLSLLRQLHLGDHAGAEDLVSRIAGNNPSAEELGSAVLFFVAIGQRQRGIDLFQKEGWLKIATGNATEIDLLYEAFLSFMPDEDDADRAYETWWAETALAILEIRRTKFGANWYPGSAVEILRPEDYRARPDVTLALARSYDEAVIAWAETELTRLIDSKTAKYDEAYQLPAMILMQVYTPEESQSVEQLLCSGKATRYAAVKYYGDLDPDYSSLDLLKYIANAPLDEEDRDTLILSVMAHAGKLPARDSSGGYNNRTRLKDYRAYLERLIAGKSIFMPPRAKPLSCAGVSTED